MRNASYSLRVFRQLIAVVIALTSLPFHSDMTHLAQAEQAEKRYGKHTLDEWQQIVKSIDFVTLGSAETVAGLLAIVKDSNAPQANRRQAAETLGRIGQPARAAVPVLAKLLTSSGKDSLLIKLWALKGLSLFGEVAEPACEAVSKLILDDSQPFQVRVNSMETLGRIGKNESKTLSTLLRIVNSPEIDRGDKQLQMAAVESMWYLGPQATSALPALIRAASDEWPLMRLAAVTTIGEIGPRAEIAIPRLVDTILFDQAGEVREAAADSLGKIGPGAVPAFKQLFADPEIEVRQLAIRGSRQIAGNSQIQELLENELTASQGILRVMAADALLSAISFHREAIETLVKELASNDRETRRRAYASLITNSDQLHSVSDELKQIFSSSESPTQSKAAARKLHDQLQDH